MSNELEHTGDAGHGDNHHPPDHPAHLAHHFKTPKQQFESGKLGMWVFLATEILMFGGLFCAYAIYRGNDQDVFLYGYGALDKMWGATNTVVLLASSLTMAWAVRAAQKGQQKLLIAMLIATFMGGVGFMVIKGVEYKAKWDHNLFPGTLNAFYYEGGQPKYPEKLEHAIEFIDGRNSGGEAHKAVPTGCSPAAEHAIENAPENTPENAPDHASGGPASAGVSTEHNAPAAVAPVSPVIIPASFAVPVDVSAIKPPASPSDMGVNTAVIDEAGVAKMPSAARTQILWSDLTSAQQKKVHLFFGIYFMMTGLHGLHVLIGMVVIAWLIYKSAKGTFGKDYFTPVDIGGLYWHLVDLIWIFLFPLLYLIH
jgi:cytochrome c oxidase subunit III